MDISQHLAVLHRWRRLIVAAGFLGLVLAALFTIKVPPKDGKIEWRRPEKWESTSRILVTQNGFPWGRTTLPGGGTSATGTDLSSPLSKTTKVDPNAPAYADPSRLSLLAVIYAFVSQSNTISDIGTKPLPKGQSVTAVPLSDQQSGSLPIIQLTTTAYTKSTANALNVERGRALAAYLESQQNANDVVPGQRVKIAVLNKPEAKMTASHGLQLGFALIFLAIAGGIAAAYVLESLRISRQNQAAAADHGALVEHPTLGASGTLRSDAPKRSLR